MSKIRLNEMIRDLRSELLAAKGEGEDEDLQFRVDDIEIEVEVVASKKADGSGKVDFWLFTTELAGELAQSSKQKLKLRLKPVTSEGEDYKVSRTGRKS